MEEHRSSSHIWHVRGEAQRQIRGAGITTNKLDQLVNLLGLEVLGSGLRKSAFLERVFPSERIEHALPQRLAIHIRSACDEGLPRYSIRAPTSRPTAVSDGGAATDMITSGDSRVTLDPAWHIS
jgi:hypothetical protein